MLSTPIQAGKRLFVKKDTELMFDGHFFHQITKQLIVIHRHVGFFKHWSTLELARCYLIMPGHYRNTQFQTLLFEVFHKFLHPLRDRSKIMVIHLLAFS